MNENLTITENDVKPVQSTSEVSVVEDSVITETSLQVIVEQFNYMEIL